MTPTEAYQLAISKQHFSADAEQAMAVQELENLYTRLVTQFNNESKLLYKLKHLSGKRTAVTGLYLWGGVGRGKTWLMDLLYDNLPFNDKLRLHFHHFMQAVHDQLELIQGHKNPLKLVAKNFAKSYRLICLDEFHVSDITDAMLLYGLLDALFKEGICLVSTSNLKPDDLYKNGLQRSRFLPAIELIKNHCQVLQVDGGTDHRLRLLEKAQTWYSPIDENTQQQLQQRFTEISSSNIKFNSVLRINYREIPCLALSDGLVWFDFKSITSAPRGAADYVELSQQFHTIFISAIPQMGEQEDDMARRFVNMIDAFYDRSVKLLASSDVEPKHLYTGRQLAFEFQRTASRLSEMRSHEYLARPHRP